MDLVNKIYLWKKSELVKEILEKYEKNLFCIINFIYFASLNSFILEQKNTDYKNALINWHFLLPDGIALKIYLKKKYIKIIQENLNGTDFTPYFLNYLSNKWYKIHLWFYTVYDEKIGKSKSDFEKVKQYIEKSFRTEKIEWFISHYSKRWEDFNFDKYRQSLSNWQYDVKLFLVGLWSPFQEVWVKKNRQFFKDNNILVMNVWWLFDFWTNFEKRAPKIIRKLNLEWLWRLGQNPKKNWKKVKESLKLFKLIFTK